MEIKPETVKKVAYPVAAALVAVAALSSCQQQQQQQQNQSAQILGGVVKGK